MAKCPRCERDIPLLSKVCTFCGYVEVSEDTNVDQFVDSLEGLLKHIKAIPEPSFGKSLSQITFILFPLLALPFLALALIYDGTVSIVFWAVFALFALLAARAIFKKSKGNLGNDPYNRVFRLLKNEYESDLRIAKQYFGESEQVSKRLEDLREEFDSIEKRRKKSNSTINLVWLIIVAVLAVIIGIIILRGGGSSENASAGDGSQQIVEGVTTGKAAAWVSMLENYRASGRDAMDAEQQRINIVSEMLSSGNAKEAEEFFLDECMGNMKDYDCAEKIVRYYTSSDNYDAAEAFASKCTSMRYRSDANKLKKQATR